MDIVLEPLQKKDLPEADKAHRISFGTFLGLGNPLDFEGDGQVVQSRFHMNHTWMTGAFSAGRLLGTICLSRQGCISLLGPVSVLPEFWDQGIGSLLMKSAKNQLSQWNSELSGLFTFPQSSKHIYFYQKSGFWPDRLMAVLSKSGPEFSKQRSPGILRFSDAAPREKNAFVKECREITHSIFPGWDVSEEIIGISNAPHSDCLGVMKNGTLQAFAICHYGIGSEGGSSRCLVKTAAVRPGTDSGKQFSQLINACELLAVDEKLSALTVGVNTHRSAAYKHLIESGYSLALQGISMITQPDSSYCDKGHFVLEDWR